MSSTPVLKRNDGRSPVAGGCGCCCCWPCWPPASACAVIKRTAAAAVASARDLLRIMTGPLFLCQRIRAAFVDVRQHAAIFRSETDAISRHRALYRHADHELRFASWCQRREVERRLIARQEGAVRTEHEHGRRHVADGLSGTRILDQTSYDDAIRFL